MVQKIQFFEVDCDTVWILGDFVNRQKMTYGHFGNVISEFYKEVSGSLGMTCLCEIEECYLNIRSFIKQILQQCPC